MRDLISIFNELTTFWDIFTTLIFMLIATGGIIITGMTLWDLRQHLLGENTPDLPPISSVPWRLMLAGAMVVAPVLVWNAANTFVLGGDATYDMFSYVKSAKNTPYCQTFEISLTMFFVLIGTISIGSGCYILNQIAAKRTQKSMASALTLLIGGIFLIFANDTAQIIGNTVSMDISFENICRNLHQ